MEPSPTFSLFDQLPIGAYRSTPDGRQLRANAALVRLNACRSEAELLTLANDIARQWYVDPQRRDQFVAALASQGQVLSFESEVRRMGTGERLWVRENAYAVRDADGRLLHFEGTVEDITEMRQAQQALAFSERRLRALIENAQVLTLVVDADGRIDFASPAAQSILGLDAAALPGTSLFERVHPDDMQRSRDEYFDVVQRRNPGVETSYRFRHADGRWRLLASLGQHSLDDEAVRGVVLNLRDITASLATETALRESEARLRLALQSAGQGLYDVDLETGETVVNNEYARMLGHDPAQFRETHQAWLDRLHPDDRDRVGHTFQAYLAGTLADYQVEFRQRTRDGHWKWILSLGCLVEPSAPGQHRRMLGTHTDLTLRKQAEQALLQLNSDLERRVAERTRQMVVSERRYRRIFESVPVAIMQQDWSAAIAMTAPLRQLPVAEHAAWLADRPALVARCMDSVAISELNPMAHQLYGIPAQEATFTTLSDVFVLNGSPEGFVDELLALNAGERRFSATRTVTRSDGSVVDVLISLAFPGPDEADGAVLVSIADITEIQRLSAALDTSLARANRANRELETFTYSVSHDLKAPLRGLDGYSQLLLRHHADALDDEGRGFLRNIHTATVQMGQLIDDLLAYSRLERQAQAVQRLALAPLVSQVLAAFGPELDRRGITPDLDLPEAWVLADLSGLTLALRNLVDNALKFTVHTAQARLAIRASVTDTGVLLSVQDNGIGFDMKLHDRIFQIFQRLQRAEDYPGTGVGLAIVSKAMDRMGGRCWADSQPGQGAIFHLQLRQAA